MTPRAPDVPRPDGDGEPPVPGDRPPAAVVPGPKGPEGGSPADPRPEVAPPVDRRTRGDRRAVADRRKRDVPVANDRRSGQDRRTEQERRTPGRRGGEYELDKDTLEFIRAVNVFKERTGKSFPTWSDILGILRELGYEKRS